MRFSNMATEFALLWVHFLWSGGLIVLFSYLSWKELHSIRKKVRTSSGSKKSLSVSMRRLFQIALLTSVCLFMNLLATIMLSFALDTWSISSDLWLQCYFELDLRKDLDAYGFEIGQPICESQDAEYYGRSVFIICSNLELFLRTVFYYLYF